MKRIISAFLVLAFVFSTIPSAHAATNYKAEEDLSLLSSIGINATSVASIRVDDGKSVYGLNYLPDNETAYITVYTNSNGNTTIDIVEGNLHDTLIVDSFGNVYYKGANIATRSTNYVSAYFDAENAPRGITSGYSKKLGSYNGNIELEEKIINVTVAVLGVYIRNALGIPGRYLAAVATPFALDIKTRAGELADKENLDTVHYTRTVWRNDSLTTSLEKFYKHICVFTIETDSSSVYKHYYELQQLV